MRRWIDKDRFRLRWPKDLQLKIAAGALDNETWRIISAQQQDLQPHNSARGAKDLFATEQKNYTAIQRVAVSDFSPFVESFFAATR